MTRSFWFSLLTAITIMLLTVLACRNAGPPATEPMETELPFETVLKFPDGPVSLSGTKEQATYQGLDLTVVTNQAKTPQTADALSSIDYDENLVIIADWGLKPTTGWAVTIECITQIKRDVRVIVRLVEPTAGGTLITHPLHVVTVSKTALTTRGSLNFVLVEGDKVILSRDYFVP